MVTLMAKMAEMAGAMERVNESVSLSRLPVPEPAVFAGDPLTTTSGIMP